jgi:predicted dehydrogenase
MPVTPSVDVVLDDTAVEGVVIATPAPTHFRLACQALKAGKHVLVEKPLTLTTADAVELMLLARQQQCLLMVGHLLEYHPAVRYIKEMIDQGELGDLYYIYSQRLNLGTVRPDENAWWSLAPHDVSVACRLLDEVPTAVQCRGQSVIQADVADVVFATLLFSGGRIAHIHVSWLDPHKTRKLTVVGSRRMVVLDDTAAGHKLTIFDKGFVLNRDPRSYADWISMRQGDIIIPKLDATEPLLLEAQHFVECIVGQRRPLSDGEGGTLVVSVLEQGQRSLERGGETMAIPVSPIPPQASFLGRKGELADRLLGGKRRRLDGSAKCQECRF